MKRKVTTQEAGKLDRLAVALKDVAPARLSTVLTKGTRLEARVSASEKEGMKQTAAGLGLSLSEYLLRLHRHASERLEKSAEALAKGQA